MERWIALLRGVNVGGGNRVPMAELRLIADGMGWREVRSYIASGNLVFSAEGTADGLAAALRAAMAAGMGVEVPVIVLSAGDLEARLARCPFAPAEGKHVHGFFLFAPGRVDAARLAELKAPTEALVMDGLTVWLHAPEGIGRSKLAEKLQSVVLGEGKDFDMTARNLNTLRALAEIAGG